MDLYSYVTSIVSRSRWARNEVDERISARSTRDLANASTEPIVSMIHLQAWENKRKVVEITPPIPVTEWAQKTEWEHERLEMLPYDSVIEAGRYAGGHVLMLHAEGTTQLWTVLPEVIPLLEGMMPDDQYRTLVAHTPKLAGLATRV